MKKYRLEKGKLRELKEEEISRHKDFKRLRANYEHVTKRPRKPFYKDPKALLGLLLIILILWLLLEETKKDETNGQGRSPDTTMVAE